MNFFFTILVCLCFHYLHGRVPLSYGRTRKPTKKTCTGSQQCPANQCCRNSAGDLIGDSDDLGWPRPLGMTNETGTCSSLKSGPGQACVESCGCVRGYTCYRTLTGVCCPPKTCWERKRAEADKKFWDNCLPPTCFLPPSANPGNVGPGLL
ncbi:uncharacterized protein LOC123532548 [Mercenaria mercenaria]|uniref:uncharacterized protein LOC123532548 n=1 Tax=Mercenaria mercenaria TaxID=6596 RepID=UPI00234E8DE6|nr:uncharacterized protein LOC123532548 [Mercenaria mercenaria]